MCDRFHCLPSQARAEGASVIRLLKIKDMGTPREEVESSGEYD